MSVHCSTRIGFIGLGQIGGPVARRLLDAGHPLIVSDLREDAMAALVRAGAEPAASAAELAAACEVVFVSLPTPQIVEQVATGEGGLLESPRCRIYIDLSTTGPSVAGRVEAALSTHGIAAVDAPVSGGVGGATAGTLSIMTACHADLFREVEPLLSKLGRPFHVGGKVGQGQMMKLVNNLLAGTALAITAEAFAIGTKGGLDPAVMLDVINASSGRNDATVNKFPRSVLDRSFAYGFASGLMHKDIDLCLSEAQRMGVPTYVAPAVRQLWLHTVTQFGATSDFTNIVRCVEQWADVQVGGAK
jgi:3-hydroxyisobutyrate dehydrogenase-like beta-hydroxyacid dehydrogenase